MDLNSSTDKNGSHNDDVSKYYRATPLAQALLEKHDIPFVGLQYVVEVQQSGKADLESNYYVCALCSKKMSSKTLVAHIRSVPHRLKFTEHHCPKLHSNYGAIQIKQWTAALVKEFSAEMQIVASNMGTFQMAVCEEQEKNPLLTTIKENIGNVDKFRSYMSSSKPATAGHSSKSAKIEPAGGASRSAGLPDFLRQKLKQGLKRDSPQQESRIVTPGTRGRSPSVVDLDSPSPKRSKRSDMGRSRSPHSRRSSRSPVRIDKMRDTAPSIAAFKKDFDNFYSRHAEKEMYYKKNPESHPEYSTEWKMFWERRYHELASKGINPNKHDFKAEWAVFWNDRMKDIFSSVLENRKEALMKKHRITKEDLEEKRPVSPWEDIEDMDLQKHLEPEHSVVGTLNALIEVESILGAFGPAIKTLLMTALKFSTEGKKTIEIFFDVDNLTLMKLSQDKLISQSHQNNSALAQSKRMKAIECCKWLVTEVERQRSGTEDFLELDIKEISSKTMGMDTVQIAQQIALSLLKIGKSDVSEDDLQKILLAVSASHAKLLMKQQQLHASRATGDVQVSSTTPTIEESREGPNTGRPLFPSAATSRPSSTQHQHQQQHSVATAVPPLAISNEIKESPSQPTVSARSKPTSSGVASGALGQLMSAYDDDPPRDMEKLSLEDLVNLLSNFKDLSRDEQVALTSYLKRLEATDSKKVTKLREMVQKNAKASEEERRKLEIKHRNQKTTDVSSCNNNENESSRPQSSQSNHQPDDRPSSRHSTPSNHSQQSGQRASSPHQFDNERNHMQGNTRPPNNQFAYVDGSQSQFSHPTETGHLPPYADRRSLPRDGSNIYRNHPRTENGSQIVRDGREMNSEAPQDHRYHNLDLSRGGPTMYHDGPPMTRDGPSMTRDGPPMTRDGPPMTRDGPPMPRDGPPMPRDGPPMPRDGPPMPRDGPPMPRDGPPMPRDGPPMFRDDLRVRFGGSPTPRDVSPMSRGGPPRFRDDPPGPRTMSPGPPAFHEGRLPLPRERYPMFRDELPMRRDASPMYRDETSRFGPSSESQYLPRDGPPMRPISPRREDSFGYPSLNNRNPPSRDDAPLYRDGFHRPMPERSDSTLGRPGPSMTRDRPWHDSPERSHVPMNREDVLRPMGARDLPPHQGRPIMRDAFDRPIIPPETDRFGPGPGRRGPEPPRGPFTDRPPFSDPRPNHSHYPPY